MILLKLLKLLNIVKQLNKSVYENKVLVVQLSVSLVAANRKHDTCSNQKKGLEERKVKNPIENPGRHQTEKNSKGNQIYTNPDAWG